MNDFFQKHRRGIIGTLLFHVALVLIFIFFGYSTPLPLPAERGILIDFGSEDGSGYVEPRNQPVNQNQQSVQDQSQTQDNNLTQDYEEAPSLDNPDKNNEQRKKNNEEDEKTVNENALFPGRSDNESNSEGNTKNNGNKGDVNGSSDADNNGASKGGSGISYSLSGRSPVGSLKKPNYPGNETGKVVVEIRVNQQGKVINATVRMRGTTISNPAFHRAAIEAAKKAVFDQKADAPLIQKGSITYNFRLE